MSLRVLVVLLGGLAGACRAVVSSGPPPAVKPLATESSNAFWAHWGDGRAEMNGYRLIQPRYGAPRTGTALLIFVT